MANKAERDEMMRRSGYIPVTIAVEKLKCEHSTVTRWIDSNVVKGTRVGHHRYVHVESLANHLGLDNAVIFGIITKDQAKALSSAQGKIAQR